MTKTIPSAVARSRSLANNRSKMRPRGANNHIEPECWPVLKPKFKFLNGAKVFTIGSCFARNIERQLATLGFSIPTMAADDFEDQKFSRNGLNKYTPPAIYQELKWAYDILGRDDMVRTADMEPLFLDRGGGKVVDMHLFPFETTTYEAAVQRRRAAYNIFAQAFNCDVIVTTLGLIEAWRDTKSNLYVLQMPESDVEAERFVFERLDYPDCLRYCEMAIDLLDSTGRKNHLITTSPIVLRRTFTDDDIIVANTYSKSVLRSVAGYLAETRDNVDYFPSYESVMLTRRDEIWESDLMHVTAGFVARIVERVAREYVDGAREVAATTDASATLDRPLATADVIHEMMDRFATMDLDAALERFRALPQSVRHSVSDRSFHMAATCLSLSDGDKAGAEFHARRVASAKRERPVKAVQHQMWIDALGRLGPDFSKALAKARVQLEEMAAKSPQIIIPLANWLLSNERQSDALDLLRLAADRRPDHSRVQLFVFATLDTLGMSEEAGRRLEKAIAAEPRSAALRISQGQFLLRRGIESEGLDSIKAAIALEPGNHNYRLVLGRELLAVGKLQEAEEQLRAAVKAQPDLVPGHHMLANLLCRQSRFDEAQVFLEEALRLEPNEQTVAVLADVRKIMDSKSRTGEAKSLATKFGFARAVLAAARRMRLRA